ncbi:MAG: GspH/FimT family pseudopilin [Burkholderiales bacterium]
MKNRRVLPAGFGCAKGFSLLELIVTVAILAIALGVAAPSLRDAVLNTRMTAQANDLMADLAVARSEAVKRNVSVFLCKSNNGTRCTGGNWSNGWVIVLDANGDGNWDNGENTLVKMRAALNQGNTVVVTGDVNGTGGARYVPYHPSGMSTAATVTFAMCDTRTGSAGRQKGRTITINRTGRAAVARRDC